MHLSATITHVMLKDLKLTSEIKKNPQPIFLYITLYYVCYLMTGPRLSKATSLKLEYLIS